MRQLEGRVVMITGASRGIGEAAARHFVELGARVALLARSEGRIAEIAGELGGNAIAVPCDVAHLWELEKAVAATEAAFGGLDVVIANAGVIEPIARMEDVDPEAWSRAVDINLKGVFWTMRAAFPALRRRGGGTIITVTSGAAHNPLEGWSHYCAAKAGAVMLVAQAHLEWGAAGIRSLGLSPGTVRTDMQGRIRESGLNPVSRLDPAALIPPEWPARALAWMTGPEADPWLGREVRLADPDIRRRLGLPEAREGRR